MISFKFLHVSYTKDIAMAIVQSPSINGKPIYTVGSPCVVEESSASHSPNLCIFVRDKLILVAKIYGEAVSDISGAGWVVTVSVLIPECQKTLLYFSLLESMENSCECGHCCISSVAAYSPAEAPLLRFPQERAADILGRTGVQVRRLFSLSDQEESIHWLHPGLSASSL